MKIIGKKILPQYFEAVHNGTKTFEYRKDEDGIEEGDYIVLREWDNEGIKYTGRKEIYKVGFVLRNFKGLKNGYCVFSILPVKNPKEVSDAITNDLMQFINGGNTNNE